MNNLTLSKLGNAALTWLATQSVTTKDERRAYVATTCTVHMPDCHVLSVVARAVIHTARRHVERMPAYQSCGVCEPGLNPLMKDLPTGWPGCTTFVRTNTTWEAVRGRRPIVDNVVLPPIVYMERQTTEQWSEAGRIRLVDRFEIYCDGAPAFLTADELVHPDTRRIELLRRQAAEDDFQTWRKYMPTHLERFQNWPAAGWIA